MNRASADRPISVAMMALGGQGGGVLTGWLVDTAEANGYIAQSTYVAGVAQRTGATVYCVEMFPRDLAERTGREPVFTPYPIPGDVDLVIAGELAETGRAIEKGFVTPDVTTLIASRHRVYSMPEKEALGDGIVNLDKLEIVAAQVARQFICFDMQAAADATGSVISSVLLGAIAASGALPFSRADFEATIRSSGRAVEANLRGFAAGYEGRDRVPARADETIRQAKIEGANGETLDARIAESLPEPVRDMALHGALRALDFQDLAYANEYLDLLLAVVAKDDASRNHALSVEVARQLALQMCYEDTIRVADLKTRSDRFERVRAQVAAGDGQPVRIVEYFHPRFEEVCDTLPAAAARALLDSPRLSGLLKRAFSKGRNVTTSSVTGFLLLRSLAGLRRFRRKTFRYARQREFIRGWLERIEAAAGRDYDLALAIARLVEIVRGYGATYERGMTRYETAVGAASTGAAIERLHRAALADEKGVAFADALRAEGAAQ